MEWDKYPDRFENIIIAIKNSTLKDSLQTIDIIKCKITKDKVSELLIKHGLTNVSVIEECNEPLVD